MKKKNLIVLLIVILILSSSGGFILGKSVNKITINKVNFKEISIRITNTQRMPAGTAYGLLMKNTSDYIIKQNTVYLSYPIKSGANGYIGNKCKAEATGNKINIKPDEEVVLNVFIPSENYENNSKLDINRPQFQIEGYVNEISNLTHFDQSGGFSK